MHPRFCSLAIEHAARRVVFLVFPPLLLAATIACAATRIEILGAPLTPHDELYSIHMSAAGQGWIVGKFGLILHSADGGKSWRRQNSGTGRALTSVSFAGARHGIAVGGSGTILTTDDGGQNWRRQSSGTKGYLLEVHARDERNAVAVGAFGTLLTAQDGGTVWKLIPLAWKDLIPKLINASGYVEPHLNAAYFADSNFGWLGGEYGLLLHTRDGGRSWSAQRYGAGLPQITALNFRDSLHGWAVGAKGTFLKTGDGGKRWEEIALPTKEDLFGVWRDGERGMIVGRNVVLQTANRGVDWTIAGTPLNGLWLSGVSGNSEHAVAVGQRGMIRWMSLVATPGKAARKEVAAS